MTADHYDTEKVVNLRENKGMTQTQVADAIGLTLRQYQRIEAGESASYEALVEIARVYQVPVTSFLIAEPQKILPS
jgi:transcriptional regulator with XRE-family HTH domain